MATTYIDLCNKVLRRLNEVEISEADFNSTRGVQALVKDAVKAAIAKINQAEYEWPFNAAEFTQTLTAGQAEYTWPSALKKVDWNSFQLQQDDALGASYTSLGYMERDEWYASHRDADYTAGSSGRAVPNRAFPSHGTGFGVTPSPNAAYKVSFRYYLNYTNLSSFGDVTRIPTSFDTVIVDGALYHMYMFKDNIEAANVAFQALMSGIKDLQTLFINNFEYVRDTRVAF
tara:strand:+ start:77 stop:766 length:690 start_codon:yes stop_codon:yes gene_type:complete